MSEEEITVLPKSYKALVLNIKDSLIKDEQAKFRLFTIAKIISVSIFTLIVQALVIYLILNIDMIFFQSHNVTGVDQFESVFFDYIINQISNYTWQILTFLIFIVVIAMYISKLIMRPFNLIGNYCEKYMTEGESASYDPDFFTDLKLLTRFSEYFFLQVETAFKNNILLDAEIPHKYRGIFKPKFELSFFLQFFIILFVVSILSTIGLYVMTTNIYESLIALASDTLVLNKNTQSFLSMQENLFRNVIISLTLVHFLAYVFLSIHLYSKVSAPAFAIFATMRSFIKGNRRARVHLIGNYHARPNTIKLNRYLDYVDKKLSKS